jgi:hypothetical protein
LIPTFALENIFKKWEDEGKVVEDIGRIQDPTGIFQREIIYIREW